MTPRIFRWRLSFVVVAVAYGASPVWAEPIVIRNQLLVGGEAAISRQVMTVWTPVWFDAYHNSDAADFPTTGVATVADGRTLSESGGSPAPPHSRPSGSR